MSNPDFNTVDGPPYELIVGDQLFTVVYEDEADQEIVIAEQPSQLLMTLSQETFQVISPASQGPPGVPGPPGIVEGFVGALRIISGVAVENILMGDPVYCTNSGQIGLARADTLSKSRVIGLAAASANTGSMVDVLYGICELGDWSPIDGINGVYLFIGTPYFLGKTGGITATPPNEAGIGVCVVVIGVAISSQILSVTPSPPVLL
jgi:hypothetical protein